MPYKDNTAIRCSWCREWTMRPWDRLRKSKIGKIFCGKICQDKWQSSGIRHGELGPNWRGGLSAAARRQAEKKNSSCNVYFIKCAVCSKLFTAQRKAETCSDKCFNKKANEGQKKRDRRLHKEYWDDAMPLICKECGIEFKPKYAGLRFYCSNKCQRRMLKAQQKKYKLIREGKISEGDDISIEVLYKRDQGKCQRCDRKLTLSSKVPNKRAPTIDHIIPLSLGGKHEWSNVQLMGFRCNLLKGNGIVSEGDQLRLAI